MDEEEHPVHVALHMNLLQSSCLSLFIRLLLLRHLYLNFSVLVGLLVVSRTDLSFPPPTDRPTESE